MKRRLLITAVAVLTLSLAAYATLAYLTGGATAHNVITSGNVKIQLLDQTLAGEELTDFPEEGLLVMPGTTASKVVSVKNLASESWVRVKLVKEFRSAAAPEPSEPGELGNPLNTDAAILNLDLENWTLGADGYYYFNSPLAQDENTSDLFTEVQFDPGMDNRYQNTVLHIYVYAEAVQSANNPIPDGGDVTDVQGWPVPTPPLV